MGSLQWHATLEMCINNKAQSVYEEYKENILRSDLQHLKVRTFYCIQYAINFCISTLKKLTERCSIKLQISENRCDNSKKTNTG